MKSILLLFIVAGYYFGLVFFFGSIVNFFPVFQEYYDPAFFFLFLFSLLVFSVTNILRSKFKKLDWKNDFLYLLIMTSSKKFRLLKEKMKKELRDEE